MTANETLIGKNVLLIGGGSGIGEAAALLLAKHGARVVIAGRRIENLKSTISKSDVPENISAIEADVTVRSSLDELFTRFDNEIGTLDFLCTCSRYKYRDEVDAGT